MENYERDMLLSELRNITRPYDLKTDTEAHDDRQRAREICKILRVEYPEDALERS